MRASGRFAALCVAVALAIGASSRQDWQPLALAAFDETWQTVNDSYFDPTFGGLNWAAVRAELRPRAEKAETPDAVRAIIRQMLGRLGQSHFNLLTTAPGDALPGGAVVPIEVRVIADALVVTRLLGAAPSSESPGLRLGDRVRSIDRHDVAAWFPAANTSDDRARRLVVWQRANRALYGASGSIARLVVADTAGRERVVEAERVQPMGELVTFGNLPPLYVRTSASETRTPAGQRVGVIGFNIWMVAVMAPFAEAVDAYRTAEGLVIDLRGNPGGLADMMRGIAGHVVREPVVIGRMRMRSADLEFRVNPRLSTADGRRVEPFSGPVAVLVDELTASASECFAGGLQSLGRVRVFGVQTMGQALPASTRSLSNGDVLEYAVGDFVTSTGRRLEGNGVVPDESVPLTAGSVATGRDLVMEAALVWMDRAK